MASADSQIGLFSEEEAKNPDTGQSLGKDSSQCGALYSHMETKNQNRIQDDIGNGSNQYGQHTGFCKSLGSNKCIHAKSQLDEDGSQRINI